MKILESSFSICLYSNILRVDLSQDGHTVYFSGKELGNSFTTKDLLELSGALKLIAGKAEEYEKNKEGYEEK